MQSQMCSDFEFWSVWFVAGSTQHKASSQKIQQSIEMQSENAVGRESK